MVYEEDQFTRVGLALLKTATEKPSPSVRAFDRILTAARMAADLSGSADLRIEDLAEAIHYWSFNRKGQAG